VADRDFTTVGLLAEIRRRARIPDADPDFTDINLLREADSQTLEMFVPLIQAARADFYMRFEDLPLVAGRSRYPIPARAIGSRVRQIMWVDSAGTEWELYPHTSSDQVRWSGMSGTPEAYAIRDDELLILPTASAADGAIRVYYEYRPARLVSSGYFTVTAVAVSSVTLSAPVTWTTASAYDFIKATPPFATIGVEVKPTGSGSNVLVPFPSASIPPRLAVGDYMCLPGESPVPQIPAELQSALALAVSAEVISQYAPEQSVLLYGKLDKVLEGQKAMLAPRSRGRSQKVVNRNSFLRRGSYRRGP
jgi:hypothetical protein